MTKHKSTPKSYPHEYREDDALDQAALSLEKLLADAIKQKAGVEARMVEDLRQFHGRYDDAVEAKLRQAKRSRVFANLTRYKANAGEGQLVDLLWPNDEEKNWGLSATPRPELADELRDNKPHQVGQTQYKDEQGNVIRNSDLARRKVEKAGEAALKMEVAIADQFCESRYGAVCRKLIHNGTVLGTGIIKGPIVEGRTRRTFQQIQNEDGTKKHVPLNATTFVPGVASVDPWDFFPDMTASNIEDAGFTFERSYLSKTHVRKLAKRKGFKPERVRKLLAIEGRQTQHSSSFVDDIRTMAGLADYLNDDRYELWEYNGPISREILNELGAKKIKEDDDPLEEILGTVFYCGGVTLGARTHLVESDQVHPYFVWNWEEDESSIFGYSVPRLTRHSQSVLNTAWRMMLDNGSITAGPQVGIKRRGVKPMDGSWELTPFKMWEIDHNIGDIRHAFSKVEFDSHQNEIAGIYNLARQLLDEEAGVPMIQQGEQGQSSATFGGMSMLMNAATTVRRRQVKMFDDKITTPLITAFYHFNMLYHPDESIKGDYNVDAKGSTALLAKETMAQALINFFNVGNNNPMFAHVFELKGNKLAKAFLQTQQLPKDVIPTDEEYEEFKKKQAENAQNQQDPMLQVETMRTEQLKLRGDNDIKLEQMKNEFDREENDLNRQVKMMQLRATYEQGIRQEKIEMMRLAQSGKLSEAKLIVELKKLEKQLEVDTAKFQTEVALKQQGHSEMRS